MKIGIIQLSDIHFKEGQNIVVNYKDAFQKACTAYVKDCQKIIFVISGDIAFSGKKNEYAIAYDFLKAAEKSIRKDANWINSYDYVLVPGNHDCDFSANRDVRNVIIEKARQSDIMDKEGIIDCCIEPQRNFWDFYSRLVNIKEEPKVSFIKSFPLTYNPDFSIEFHCYNTSLLSNLEEKPGSLIVPTNKYLDRIKDKSCLVISLFHHNPGWLSTNTINNKKSFEAHLLKESDIVMCGHEHSSQHLEVSSINDSDQLVYLESPAFQEENNSEFNILKFDNQTKSLTDIEFKLDLKKCIYSCTDERTVSNIKKVKGICLRYEFENKLESIDIPLKHPDKDNLKLSDIYVYPDLEPFVDIDAKVIEYTDSSILSSDKENGQIIFLEGENQSGKTSLIRMTYLSLVHKSFFPLLIRGKDINYPNIKLLLKSTYKEQYDQKSFSYDEYCQLSIDKKVLLIEDFDDCELNKDGVHAMLEEVKKTFSKVIMVISPAYMNKLFFSGTNNEKTKFYHIKSLSYEKRNQLIEKWLYIGRDQFSVNHTELERKVRLTFDQITNLLGEQYMPSYPVFILSLLQSLNNSLKSFEISKTSYGYCYYSLIIVALIRNGVRQEKVEGIIQFLSKLAFSMFEKSKNTFTLKDYQEFYQSYIKTYRASYSQDRLIHVLISSYIIKESESNYKFTYKYIFYYLIAASISQIKDEKKQSEIVEHLCNNMHKEKEANILIFLVNQNVVPDVIEQLLFYSCLPFENLIPVTLDTKDRLFSQIKSFAEKIKLDVIRDDVNPHEERVKDLKAKDEEQRKLPSNPIITEEEIDKNKDLRDVSSSIKIIRILGQIVKNQRFISTKEELTEMVKEAYNVSFRTIAFFSEMIRKSKDEIIEFIKQSRKTFINEDAAKIENRVTKVLQSMLYRFCLDNFSNISNSVGAPEMEDVFDQVAIEMNTPAAKIVTFTINSYYNKLKIDDLKNIMEEFKNNPVAREIVRARVINYVYHNNVERDVRQKISNICDFKLVDRIGFNRYIVEKYGKKNDKAGLESKLGINYKGKM